MDWEKWNEHYLQQDEAEKNKVLRLIEEITAAKCSAIVQRYNLFAGQLRELIPKLFKFYEENPPSEHYWLEIEGKKIASWLLASNIQVRRRYAYIDLFDLYLLVDGRIALYCTEEDPNEPGGERVRHYKPTAEFFRFIKLKYEEDISLISYTETAHEYINILESACKYIKDILEAPERERQAKIAAEQQAKKDVEERRERLHNFPRVVVGKPENTTVLEQQKNTAGQISSSPVTRFGKSFESTIQNIYEISVEVLYGLFGVLICIVLVFIALFFLGSGHPSISIVFCAIALYVFIRICTKKFKHKKVETLISQYRTKN